MHILSHQILKNIQTDTAMKKFILLLLSFAFAATGIFAQTQNYEGGVKYKKRRATGTVEIQPGASSTIEFNDGVTIQSDGTKLQVMVGSTEKFVINDSVTFVQSISGAKVGGTAGWVVNAGANLCLATLPASQTGSTLVIPITIPLKVGTQIKGFTIIGQIESGGGTATLTAELRKLTAAAADVADASVGSLLANVSVTADAALSYTNARKGGLTEVVAANETFYILVTSTTAGATDIALQGITLTIIE